MKRGGAGSWCRGPSARAISNGGKAGIFSLHYRSCGPAPGWQAVLAVAVLLGTSVGCGTGSDDYACRAACPGREPVFYSACKSSSLQEALNEGGCPAQTQCSTPNALCSSL
jgi:hypothetical protein